MTNISPYITMWSGSTLSGRIPISAAVPLFIHRVTSILIAVQIFLHCETIIRGATADYSSIVSLLPASNLDPGEPLCSLTLSLLNLLPRQELKFFDAFNWDLLIWILSFLHQILYFAFVYLHHCSSRYIYIHLYYILH